MAFGDVHGVKHGRALDGCGGVFDLSALTVWSNKGSIPNFSAASSDHFLGFEIDGGQPSLAAPQSPTGWPLAKFLVEQAIRPPAVGTFTELFA